MYNVYAECQMLSSVAPGKILSPDVLYFLPQPPVLPCEPLHTLDVPFQLVILLGHTFPVNKNFYNACFNFLKSFCILQSLLDARCSVQAEAAACGDGGEGVCPPLGPRAPGHSAHGPHGLPGLLLP